MTFIQRFDSALRLNVHVHTLALDGVYVREDDSMGEPVFRALPAPTADEVFDIAERTAKRVVAALKKRGRAVDGLWDEGSTVDDFDPALVACYGVAARASALRMVEGDRPRDGERVSVVMGFDIHAGAVIDGRDCHRGAWGEGRRRRSGAPNVEGRGCAGIWPGRRLHRNGSSRSPAGSCL
ncbi:transposase [Polyangium jinanense]|uniref:Transposase n=1 Tax=Polyangium jinanense TaxID=2829994 RepID=A0A9X3X5V2_9BACT|nr:transposase [Polyangium jinanense]